MCMYSQYVKLAFPQPSHCHIPSKRKFQLINVPVCVLVITTSHLIVLSFTPLAVIMCALKLKSLSFYAD